jgi:hypothetical protein
MIVCRCSFAEPMYAVSCWSHDEGHLGENMYLKSCWCLQEVFTVVVDVEKTKCYRLLCKFMKLF